jgi:UDP-N-acetylglucosamine pyrophosphorylase
LVIFNVDRYFAEIQNPRIASGTANRIHEIPVAIISRTNQIRPSGPFICQIEATRVAEVSEIGAIKRE